jgi:hypothetical protein
VAVFGASLEDHNERFTRNDLKNLREWSVKHNVQAPKLEVFATGGDLYGTFGLTDVDMVLDVDV